MKRSDISTLDVLEAAELAHTERRLMTWQYIAEKTKAPEKVIYAAINREVGRDYLDYGVSLRTAFLTERGEEKLRELRARKE